MDFLDRKTLTEAVLYILNATKGIDFYHVFKIMYFAEQKHLVRWGTRMTEECYLAYEYGPVPSSLYSAVKSEKKGSCDMLKGAVSFAGEDAPNVLLPLRTPDMDYLAQSDIECLDESIRENAHLTFGQLKEKSHDSAWREAYENKTRNGNDAMSVLSIARAAGATEEMLDYIQEQTEELVLA
jgi:uncharacterized phage-associated protein